ncbi:hypothetical protein Tco_1473113 [Tanacetum coccineum]
MPVVEDALILLPTPDKVVAAQPDPLLAKKSKGPSQKRASEAGSSVLELGRAKGLNEADITDFCVELEDSMERDDGTSIRASLVSTPRLGKRLGPPPSMVVASVSRPPLVETSAHASISGRSLTLRGSVAGGFAKKSRDEAMLRQMDPLDPLARSALSRDAEYDEIPEDYFGTATHVEEIELTLFPLAPSLYQMSYTYEGVSSPLKALDRTITPVELRKTESLLSLELSNRVNVLSAPLVSHGFELNSRYTDLVSFRVRLQEKLNRMKGDVKVWRTENYVLKEMLLLRRDLQNELALERSKSQGYKDDVDELRTEVTQFIGSGVEGLV